VHLVHVPALRITQRVRRTCAATAAHRPPSCAVVAAPGVRLLSSPWAQLCPRVFPVEFGAPQCLIHCAPPLAAARRRSRASAGRRLLGTCAHPGPPDRDPTARVGLDLSPRGSNPRHRARKPPGPSDLDSTDQIRHRRVKPAVTLAVLVRSFHFKVFLRLGPAFFVLPQEV
jgi:hypothetical protein